MPVTSAQLFSALECLAPLHLAEDWDRVGLQVEGRPGRKISRVFLTIDLVAATLDEAMEIGAQAIVAYHPPIFAPLRALRRDGGKSELILRCAERGLHLYSPHTALDAAPGGINDWLAGLFGPAEVSVIDARSHLPESEAFKLVVYSPVAVVDTLREALSRAGAGRIGNYVECSFAIPGRGSFRGLEGSAPVAGVAGRLEDVDEIRLEMVVGRGQLAEVLAVLRSVHPYEEPAFDLFEQAPRPSTTVGQGRRLSLKNPLSLEQAVRRVKKGLGLSRLRLAAAERHRAGEPIRRVALCAGAGGGVLDGQAADLWLTGEMRHHDVLAAREAGISVLLAEHTNTERGYLPVLRDRLLVALDHKVEVVVSERDADPLTVV